MAKNNTIAGCRVQVDASGGQGHCWHDVDADNMPANVRMEIEGEILDGHSPTGQIVASNGQRYRWE